MGLIDICGIINGLSDESLEKLSRDLRPFLTFYYADPECVSREMLMEKIGQYLEILERKTNLRDHDLAGKYVSELFPYVLYRISNDSRATAYYLRMQKIKNEINSCDDEQVNISLEDFSKLFLCLYDQYLKNEGKPVENFNFYVESVNFHNLLDYLKNDTPQRIKLPEIPLQPVKKAIPQGIVKGLGQVAAKVPDVEGVLTRLPGKKKDMIFEPIHDRIEDADEFNTYSVKNYSYLMLTIYYYSLYDFENGSRRDV